MSWKYLIRKSWTWRWWRLALSNTHRWAPTLRWKYKFQCRLLLRQLGSPTGDQKYLTDCSSKCHRHDFHCDGDEAHVKPVVSPTSKLDGAMLVVEGEPSDVNLAGGLQSKQDLYSTKVGKRITLKMPGGMYVQVPSEVTTTLVGNVPSKASLALQLTWDLTFFRWRNRVQSETDVFYQTF